VTPSPPRKYLLHTSIGLVSIIGACTQDADGRETAGLVSITSASQGGLPGSSSGSTSGSTSSSTSLGSTEDSAASASSAGDPSDTGGFKYDLGNVEGFCTPLEAGVYCNDNQQIVCEMGEVVDQSTCAEICIEGTGCAACVEGQYTCKADNVMVCNANTDPPIWEVAEKCEPSVGEGCDLSQKKCAILTPVGTPTPTGEYYKFAQFASQTSPFNGGADVDGFGDKLYVLSLQNTIDIYQVSLADSDMDGELEPNQHPDNPDNTGPIEERTLHFVESIPTFGSPSVGSSELLAMEDRLYIGGKSLTEKVFGLPPTQVSSPPPWGKNLSHLGYDAKNDLWYASNESMRRVFQYDPSIGSWGIAFLYPDLAGSHMDGLEVVIDPNTSIPYVYVSDMTSDFIGQYRMDPELGWVQENLFEYSEDNGAAVEGLGFGPLSHFWATSGQELYEVGGGSLAEYTEDPTPPG